MSTLSNSAPQETSTNWIEVETVHHSCQNKEVKITIIKDQSNQVYSAITYEKHGKRWIACEDVEVTPNENWSEVLDQVIAQVSGVTGEKHHANKLWEVRK